MRLGACAFARFVLRPAARLEQAANQLKGYIKGVSTDSCCKRPLGFGCDRNLGTIRTLGEAGT
jgi:hypothetical protein